MNSTKINKLIKTIVQISSLGLVWFVQHVIPVTIKVSAFHITCTRSYLPINPKCIYQYLILGGYHTYQSMADMWYDMRTIYIYIYIYI